MRKLKLQVQMTVDGYIAGSNGEMDWMALDWGEDIGNYVTNLTANVDCILLGRKLAQGFIPHWAAVAADPDNPAVASGKLFTNLPKVVFSKTLAESVWDNTILAQGDLVDEVLRLKQQVGKDIIVYGGGTFVSALIQHGLIDEFHLFVNPAALGKGMPIFQGLEQKQALVLKQATAFVCGIVVLCYERKDGS